jgi:hypothetical protein
MAGRRRRSPYGRYTVYDIDPVKGWLPLFSRDNTLMVSWGFAAAKLFGDGDRNYRINRMYIEFENVASPGDAISVPTYDEFDSRSYYDNLASPRDYLRVPLIGAPELFIGDGYADYFTAGTDGNALRFFAQSVGTSGINGLAFSDGVNSKAFGLALVASPDDGDRTKDVLVTRGYFPVNEQKLKASAGQIGVGWELVFEPID